MKYNFWYWRNDDTRGFVEGIDGTPYLEETFHLNVKLSSCNKGTPRQKWLKEDRCLVPFQVAVLRWPSRRVVARLHKCLSSPGSFQVWSQVLGCRRGRESREGRPTVLKAQTWQWHTVCAHTCHWQELSRVTTGNSWGMCCSWPPWASPQLSLDQRRRTGLVDSCQFSPQCLTIKLSLR